LKFLSSVSNQIILEPTCSKPLGYSIFWIFPLKFRPSFRIIVTSSIPFNTEICFKEYSVFDELLISSVTIFFSVFSLVVISGITFIDGSSFNISFLIF